VKAYADTSVVLRVILQQPGALANLETIALAVSSALVEVECLRALDRLRVLRQASDSELVSYREAVYRTLNKAEIVEISVPILRRAGQPLAAPLGTLDAIHLATALEWMDDAGEVLVMATHDHALGAAARASGLQVIGVGP
jgi:predicted nucleic acid-binding protein